jgi:eukaryotic-like serine/threonine-protein kinase
MPPDPQKARELFLHAVGKLPPERWEEFVAEGCGGDAELNRHVSHLLQVHRDAGSFLESPAVAFGDTGGERTSTDRPASNSHDQSPVQPGTVIGPYKLLQPIGEGGMGTVYMAEQAQPVRRTVALKLVKAGMDSRQVLARFGAERQALAVMDHPSIAKVLDAGATEQGRPYFVMELVKGIPITKFCDERRLTLRERLELAIPVCQAVQHAHQKGIIHRDLKPSNVLIASYDGKPVPKVIDFGVAKATGPRLTDQTLYTEFGAVVGTLEYMSPEQAELNQLDVDTRSDIYSLGVLLYELVTGSTPLEHERIKEGVFLELLRVIREDEPPRPSMRISMTEELPAIAACRHVEPRKLSGLVRGELDWIVMKALEKDRNRRYETANGLAADLRHYLDDEPVAAGPPTAAYRLSKFAKRYRLALATACAFAAVLIGASVMSFWQAVRANRATAEAVRAYAAETKERREVQNQRDRALKAESEAKVNLAGARAAVEDYLTTISESRLLTSPLPGLQPLRKELLATALKYYEGFVSRHQDDPELRADLAAAQFRVGEITDQIGSKEDAVKAFQTALGTYESLARAIPSDLSGTYRAGQGRSLVRLAMIQANHGESDKSLMSFARSISLLDQVNRDQPADPRGRADLALAHHYMGLMLIKHGTADEAVRHQRAAIDLRKGLTKEFPNQFSYRSDLARSLSNLGYILFRAGRSTEALDPVREANAIQRSLAREHQEDSELQSTLALSTRGMAVLLKNLGRMDESKRLYVESVGIMDRIVTQNPAVTEFRRVLATGACELGRFLIDRDEAEAALNLFAKARDQAETVKTTNPNDGTNLNTLASIHRGIGKALAKQGKTALALLSLRESIVLGERIAAEDNLFTYDLACSFALYGEIIGQDRSVPDKDRNKNSEHYLDKAMEVFRQAVDRGWRDEMTERDPDLRSLHSRADFQALLKTMRQTSKPVPAGN